MKNYIKAMAVSVSLLAMTTACTGDFDEINTNPDAYSSVPYTNVLADCLRSSATQWTNLDIAQWAGYVAEIQYMNDYTGYIPTNNTYGNRWYRAYWVHVQLQDILDKTEASAEANKNLRNVCIVWQNYLMYLNLTCFGDMPYSEAFKGAPEYGSVLQAKYDKQSEIYPQILNNLKTVADSWAAGLGTDDLGSGDFLFNGDVAKWQKFCNSLRMKIAVQISGVYSDSQSIFESIINNPTAYPYITANADNAYFWWQGTSPYYEPWYDNKRTRDDDGMADIFINHLKSMSDPRLPVYAKPATSDGEYRGIENGYDKALPDLSVISRIGAKYRDDPKGATPYYRACETYYMMAEAALNGWKTPMTAEEAYTQGVKLSMADNDVADADVTTYLAGKGKWDNTKSKLYFEWWVGLFKEDISAWTLYRRTGYPTYIHTAKAYDGVTPEYPGIKSGFKGIHNDVPFRFAYPNNQFLYNKANVTAASTNIVDYVWGEKLWWDTRSTDYH